MSKNFSNIDLIYKLCIQYESKSLFEELKDLGIDPSLPEKEIKRKLRDLAVKNHPDREFGDEKMFKNVMKIYERFMSNKLDNSKLTNILDKYSPMKQTMPEMKPVEPLPKINKHPWGNWYK